MKNYGDITGKEGPMGHYKNTELRMCRHCGRVYALSESGNVEYCSDVCRRRHTAPQAARRSRTAT